MEHIRQQVAEDFAAVNALILEQLHSEVTLVDNIGHYIIDGGGKRLRPLLVLLTANAVGYRGRDHISLAAIIEFLHTATLLHDDVVDISQMRRGRETANARWGNAPSVLVGDFIYSRAFQMMVGLGDMPVMHLLSDTTVRIAEGEVLQLTKAGDTTTDETAYLEVITHKTAVLFAAATKGAGLLGGCTDTELEALYRYGLELGIAFQIADDALDYQGSADAMGKNVGDDLAEGKPTLPLIHILQHGTEAQRAVVEQAISNRSNESLPDVMNAITETRALDYTLEVAHRHADAAGAALTSLPPTPFRDSLMQLTALAVDRST